MEKEIIQIQLALFFSNDYNGSFEEFSMKLKKGLGESKTTQYIPVPTNAPSEIPRLTLVYDQFSINVSKNRLDLFSRDYNSVKDNVPMISEVLLTDFNLLIERIGLVKNFFIGGSIEDLKSLLPREKIENIYSDLKEINIRINSKKTIEGYECNNIENLNVGYVTKKNLEKNEEVRKEGLITVRDINIINKNSLDKEKIDKLINAFNNESDNFILLDLEDHEKISDA